MLILSLFTAWGCPPGDWSPCANLHETLAAPIGHSALEAPESGRALHAVDEPFVYYVEPSVRDAWEDSIEVAATLDGAPIEPVLSLEDEPPFVRLTIDVPVGAELDLTADVVTSSGTNPFTQLLVGAEPHGSSDPDPVFDLDLAEFEMPSPCVVHSWEYRGDARGWILVRPAHVDMPPLLRSLEQSITVETTANTPDQCEALLEQAGLGEPIDLLVWRVHPDGQVSGPVLLAHPDGALEAAGPRPSTQAPTGCSTAGLTWTWGLGLVPFALRRRKTS